ncbi:MAG: hypothetical protein RL518_1633 [Pseudomonadota bacterium]|jgi:hypothetical protein
MITPDSVTYLRSQARRALRKMSKLGQFCYYLSVMRSDSQTEEQRAKEELLKLLQAEIAALLCADHVREDEKLSRMKLAQAIIEKGEV